jgi:hypothetical protein
MGANMTEGTLIAVFAAVILLCVILSWIFGSAKPTIQAFYWGDQKIRPSLVASLLLSSSFSLNGLLYQTWLGFQIGWWSILVQVIWCAGFLFLALKCGEVSNIARGWHHARGYWVSAW